MGDLHTDLHNYMHQLICVGRILCTDAHAHILYTHTHAIIQAFCAHYLYPVWCSASGPSLAALPNKLLAVHCVLNSVAL